MLLLQILCEMCRKKFLREAVFVSCSVFVPLKPVIRLKLWLPIKLMNDFLVFWILKRLSAVWCWNNGCSVLRWLLVWKRCRTLVMRSLQLRARLNVFTSKEGSREVLRKLWVISSLSPADLQIIRSFCWIAHALLDWWTHQTVSHWKLFSFLLQHVSISTPHEMESKEPLAPTLPAGPTVGWEAPDA